MAVYDHGRTYFVWSDATWNVQIAYYDHASGITSNATKIGQFPDFDAHRNPALLIDADGNIFVFWGSHGQNTIVSRSFTPRDISSFVTVAPILGATSYPQPCQLSADAITVFYRNTNSNWCYRKSTDHAASWGSEVEVAHSELSVGDNHHGVYALMICEEGAFPRRVHLYWTALDDTVQVRKNFWYATSADGVAWTKSDGTAYSTLPIDSEAVGEKIFDSGSDQVNTQDIQLDSVGNPYVLISHGANGGAQAENGGPWHFKLLKKKSGVWTAYYITDGDHQFDNGGLVILADNDFRAILPTSASQVNEDGGNMEEWKSTDKGETWIKLATLTNDPLSHNNVKVVRGHQPDFVAFWSYGDSIAPSPVTLKRYGSGVVTTIVRS